MFRNDALGSLIKELIPQPDEFSLELQECLNLAELQLRSQRRGFQLLSLGEGRLRLERDGIEMEVAEQEIAFLHPKIAQLFGPGGNLGDLMQGLLQG